MRLTRSLICSGAQGVAGEGQPDHRRGIGLDLGDDRLVDGLGQRLRTREVRSRTSAAALSASFSRRKRTVIWLARRG
jgi:hypothetical protein